MGPSPAPSRIAKRAEPRRRNPSLRARLVFLFLLVLVPAFLLGLFTAFEDRRRAQSHANSTAFSIAVLLAARLEAAFASTQQLLQAFSPQADAVSSDSDCRRLFADLGRVSTQLAGFTFSRSDEVPFCSTLGNAAPARADAGVIRQPQPHTSDFVIGSEVFRLADGQPVLLASQQVPQRHGGTGMLTAALDLQTLSEIGARLALPVAGVLMILHESGIVIARFPEPEKWVGRHVEESAVFRQLRDEPQGGVIQAAGLDDVQRIYGHVMLTKGQRKFFVTAALNREEVYAGSEAAMRRNVIALLALALFSFVGVVVSADRWVGNPLGRMVAATNRIATGDLTARVRAAHEPAELRTLAEAINVMAGALQDREHRHVALTKNLQNQTRRVAALSRRLLNAHEAERRAIARELHDEIGQSMTALKLTLQTMQRAKGAARGALLVDAIAIAGRTLDLVRSMSLGLRPAMLDHLGVEAAVRWHVQQQATLANLDVQFDLHLPRRLPDLLETTLFRIVQEALTNTIRHAGATHIRVDLSDSGAGVQLLFHDNGRGFSVSDASASMQRGKSMGLLSMEERAALAGGELTIQSDQAGTIVKARFPVAEQST